ncbi:hypothetical protein HDU84_006921 [Entophlyctis sp. JEL0112]|nr:hypothetical protein HDU84_006921 [Entophlyctis sp. JEL0112]
MNTHTVPTSMHLSDVSAQHSCDAGAAAAAAGVIVATPDEGDAFPPAFTHPQNLHRSSMPQTGPSSSHNSLGRDNQRQNGVNHHHSPSLSFSDLQRSGSTASASSGNPYYSKGYALGTAPSSSRTGRNSHQTAGRSVSIASNWFTESFTFEPVTQSQHLDEALEQSVNEAPTLGIPQTESALANGLAAEPIGTATADADATLSAAARQLTRSQTNDAESQIEDDTLYSTATSSARPSSLSDIAEVAFGRAARNLVTVLFSLELFTAATGLLILAADSIHSLQPTWDPLLVKVVVSCVLVATTLPRGFAFLAWSSVFGVTTLIALFGILVGTGLSTPPPGPGTVWVPAETSMWPPAGFDIWPAPPPHGGHAAAPSMWLAAGLIVVGLDAHAIYPGIYCDLKEKPRFGSVVGTAYFANWSLYTVFAGIGYIMFGKDILPQVTQNFALIPGFSPAVAKFILVITALNPFTKFALIMAPVILRIEQILGIPLAPPTSTFVSPSAALPRILLGILAVLTTIQFPSFHTLMGLVGSIFSFALAGVVPCACFLRLTATRAIPFRPAETVVCTLVVFGAAALAVVGTAAGMYSH